jgi:hypothetical protein
MGGGLSLICTFLKTLKFLTIVPLNGRILDKIINNE